MNELFLVTTSLEKTWPDKNKKILFLGEWCRIYSRKNIWENMDANIVPYHWDDRKKLYNDYQYLVNLFEKLLKELVVELNNIHGVSYSQRYWRIIIGPWLMMFLPIIFDRWTCINIAIEKYPVTKTKILKGVDINYAPQSMEHFLDISKLDLWNHAVYSSILEFIEFKDIFTILKSKTIPKLKPKKNVISKIKEVFSNMSLFSNSQNYFFIGTYLSKIDLIKLNLKLGQIPIYYKGKYCTELAPQDKYRKMTMSGLTCTNKFEKFVKKILPLQIPTIYLEGYDNIPRQIKKMGWPKEPKLIWTSNSYLMDDIFKFWAAKKVENGIPLIIGQHGGHYGQGLFNISEYHELKICDKFLSWGWHDNKDKIIPLGTVKKPVKKRKNFLKHFSILLLISGTPRYSDGMASMPVSSQWLLYFDDQMEFYKQLPSHLRDKVTVRFYPHDYKWSQSQRWKDRFPKSKIDKCEEKFNNAISKIDLFVSGWNTTSYLETMLSNIPTIIFWEPSYFEIRDDAKYLFKKLKKVKIFHDNPYSASDHVKNISGNVNVWWNSDDVLSVKNEFISKYAYSHNLIDKMSTLFKDISKRKC